MPFRNGQPSVIDDVFMSVKTFSDVKSISPVLEKSYQGKTTLSTRDYFSENFKFTHYTCFVVHRAIESNLKGLSQLKH